MISLKYNLVTKASEIPEKFKGTHQKLEDYVEITGQTMGMIRSQPHRLRPPVMDVGGLNLHLQELCWDFSQRTGLQIDYQGDDIPGLPDEIGISLYRFAQEARFKYIKHSKAIRVDIRLLYKKGT